MIKIKYKILNQTDNRIELFVLYEDNSFTVLNLAQDTLENVLKNAYILSQNIERLQYEGEIPENLEVLELDHSPDRLVVTDWYSLDGKVYDQYGEELDTPIDWSIEGTDKAKIEEGKVVTEDVEEETSFFIVVNVGELEKKTEKKIYPKVEEINVEELLTNRIANLETQMKENTEVTDAIIGGDVSEA